MENDQQKSLKQLVERRHPEYDALIDHWNFLQATYEGGRAWFDDHIFKYLKEGDGEYKDRITRAYRFNHTREVVDLLNKYIFKMDISRSEDAPDSIKGFWGNATKNGMPIEQFSREISRKSSIGGRIWVVVDSTNSEEVRTKADEKRAGARPFAYAVMPQHVLDFSYDEHGDLNWILIHEIGRDDDDPLESSGKLVNRYRLWTRTEWALFKEEKQGRKTVIVEDGRGEHGLGEVPVVRVDNLISDEPWSAPALIADIAYLDRAVANYLSNLDAIIQDQTFSQLAMPAQNVLPGEDAYQKLVDAGTKRIFLYDGEGNGKPFYLSPDPAQARLILEVVNKIISEIYHSVGMAGERTKEDNSMGIDNSSGVAKAYDFERVNSLLVSKADALELAENRICRLAAMWAGEKVKDGETWVTYPETFDVRGLYDEFDIATKLSLIEAPDTMRQEQMKTVIEKLFPRLKEEVKNKMLNELKGWPPKPDPMMPTAAPGSKLPDPKKSQQGQNNKRAPVDARTSSSKSQGSEA